MKIIELHEDYAKVEVNGKQYDLSLFQNSKELIVSLDFLEAFENFEEMNQCDECEQGWSNIGEGDESHFVRCECQPKIIL